MTKPGPKVEIPARAADKPAWSRVGIIGFAGFVVGIVWPRLLGVSLAPELPGGDEKPTEGDIASEPVAAPEPVAIPLPAAGKKPVSNEQQVVVGDGDLTGCRDQDNKKVEKCDALKFDPIAKKGLRELAKCPSALGLEGALSIGFDIDFKNESVTVLKGDDTTLPSSTVAGVLACAGEELEDVELKSIHHEHRGYKIFYKLDFYPPGKAPPAPEGDTPAEPIHDDGSEPSGLATVSWDTALVRSRPKDGDIVARLLHGTRVKLLERQDDWYRIDAGTATGWVYKQAVGLE
jgi:hypothetical protein